MKWIIRKKQKGKTTEILKLAEKTNSYILIFSHARKRRYEKLVEKNKLNIPGIIAYNSLIRGSLSNVESIVIDDVDEFLYSLLNIKIIAISGTEDENDER